MRTTDEPDRPTTWSTVPTVFVVRPACPFCGCERYVAVRSMATESDGSKTLRCVCRRCSGRFLVVTEPGEREEFSDDVPENGKTSTSTS